MHCLLACSLASQPNRNRAHFPAPMKMKPKEKSFHVPCPMPHLPILSISPCLLRGLQGSRGSRVQGCREVDTCSYVACQINQRLVSREMHEQFVQCRTSQGYKIPFRAPWKKNLTMKTCSPAMVTMRPTSMRLKLKIRFSVLLTVEKLRFSRVRKYFWLREMVESWAESLRMDSSRTEVCSGVLPCLFGILARAASFSTCELLVCGHCHWARLELGMCVDDVTRTAISKSTIFSAKVLISLLKQNLYSPTSLAVKTKSP